MEAKLAKTQYRRLKFFTYNSLLINYKMNKPLTDIFDESLQYKLSHNKDTLLREYQNLVNDFDKIDE